MFYKRLIFFLVFISLTYRGLADVFVVTNNADVGTGTLREALTLAAANGSTTTDYINFNLPDLSEAGRTITISSQLPLVTSNLIIDGSTQAGNKFGVSDAKVILAINRNTYIAPIQNYTYTGIFILDNVSDVEIYGLAFLHSIYIRSYYAISSAVQSAGIYTINTKKIKIGAASKGNVFNDCDYGILGSGGGKKDDDIQIKGNFFALGYDGKSLPTLSTSALVNGIVLYGDNLFIGGDNPGEKNHFGNTLYAAQISGTGTQIINNNFAVDFFNNLINGPYSIVGSKLTCSGNDLLIRNNKSVSLRMQISGSNNFQIYANTEIATNGDQLQAIEIISCENGTVGSEDINKINTFIGTENSTITSRSSKNISILKNSIKCSSFAYLSDDNTKPAIKILVNTDIEYSGTATPNSTVYIYEDNTNCLICNPVVFYTKVQADATGAWKMTGAFTNKKWVANTTLLNNSSEFTQARFLKYTNYFQTMQPSCGQNNGSIKLTGYQNLLKIEWYNDSDVKIGTGDEIKNLSPGTYYAIGSNGNCITKSGNITLYDVTIKIRDNSLVKTQPSCSQNNGSIKGLILLSQNQPVVYKWTNQNNQSVSNGIEAFNLGPGTYMLTATDQTNLCTVSYGPITLINTNGPGLDQSQAIITPTNCGQSIGSITGITATGSGTLIYTWKNAQQQIVGNTANLLSQPAGVYTLEVKDGGTCGPVFSSAITIPELNGITLNETAVVVVPASCSKSNGSVKGITATGATTYAWYNSNNGLVENGAELSGVPPGNYYLVVSNTTCSKQSKTYTVIQDVDVITASATPLITNDECGQNKGSITGLKLSGGLPPYNYQWTDAANNIVSTTTNANNLGAGIYTLAVTDGSSCGAFSATYIIQNQTISIPAPVASDVKICNSGKVLLAVNNTSSTYGYRLYDTNNSLTALADEKLGKFSVNVTANRSYYISQYLGQCESARTEVKVSVGISALDIANTFTPNGDSINDVWKIKGIENAPFATVQVFNRNGLLVFESNGYSQPFDGTIKNQPLATGAYFYVINMGTSCNVITGSLTIIR